MDALDSSSWRVKSEARRVRSSLKKKKKIHTRTAAEGNCTLPLLIEFGILWPALIDMSEIEISLTRCHHIVIRPQRR